MNFDKIKSNKVIYVVLGLVIIIVCVIACIIMEQRDNKENQYSQVEQTALVQNEIDRKEEKKKIKVHIAGEVNKPGIVEIDEGSRIIDIVSIAGGFTGEADVDRVNLAYEVEDEQKIIIPNKNDKNKNTEIIDDNEDFIASDTNSKKRKLNINKATQSELESLTGVGPSMAAKILEYRKKNGPFKTIDSLKNVPGIGKSKYDGLKEEICVK